MINEITKFETIMKKLLIIICWSLTATFSYGQNRVERPIQVHANFSGLFLDIAGNGLADATVDELKVNSWAPGISLGYHLNRYIYVGYSLYSPLDMTLKESWGLTFRALDANIVLEHQTGVIHNLEARFSPFKFGLYLSLGYTNIGKVDYQMQFKQMGEEVLIGNNSYATDLDGLKLKNGYAWTRNGHPLGRLSRVYSPWHCNCFEIPQIYNFLKEPPGN